MVLSAFLGFSPLLKWVVDRLSVPLVSFRHYPAEPAPLFPANGASLLNDVTGTINIYDGPF